MGKRFEVSVANDGTKDEVLFIVDKDTGLPRSMKKNIRVEKLERFTIYIIDEKTENEMVILVDDKNGNAYTTKQISYRGYPFAKYQSKSEYHEVR